MPSPLTLRSLQALDWPDVLAALARHARTLRGARHAGQSDLAADAAAVRERYLAVAEVWRLEEDEDERIPVGAVEDVAPHAEAASRGVALEAADLRAVGGTLGALTHLRHWLDDHVDVGPTLARLAWPIEVDADLRDLLDRAFDEVGQLSGTTWPDLGALRQRIGGLKARIRTTLDDILGSAEWSPLLQERYITERDGRTVLPIKAGARRGLGIVHATSGSGETVFVEPAAVVELSNDLKEAEAALEREEKRILAELSGAVGRSRRWIDASLAAATEIDLACARAGLGRTLDGVLPEVGERGVISLSAARHPVLVLRGVAVVANDLSLSPEHPGLVLTGPNTGGKTVALKTLGLAALMARSGVPVPAADGARVDFFDGVLADIGDAQAVQADLSTFSGHLLVLREMLAAAGPGVLVLLDEIGVGTDPVQGAALARAALEWLVDRGSRVVVTTHYAELKALAASDDRFRVGAMQLADGQPTYRIEMGLAGESHALTTARRLQLPAALVDRARALMDVGSRQLTDLLEELEEQRNSLGAAKAALADQKAALADRERALAAKERSLAERREKLQHEVSERFAARLRVREHEVKGLIAALQENPRLDLAGRTLDTVREALAELEPPEPEPEPIDFEPEVGDRVHVLRLSKDGDVVSVDGRDRFTVKVGALTLRLRGDELGAPHSRSHSHPARAETRPVQFVEPKKPKREDDTRQFGGMRLVDNTADLRGMRVDDALDALDLHFDRVLRDGGDTCWVLHGHGTGALKSAVRCWLPSHPAVKRWRPADPGEGGDAYTVVQLA